VISIKHDIARIGRNAGRIEKQLPFTTALALTRTINLVQKAEIAEMRDVFDRPTPFTLNSTYAKGANKQNLRAEMGFKDQASGISANKFLKAQIGGGVRRLKRFEIAMRNAGIMPNGYVAVPGTGANIDAYGNMSRGQINQILSYFKVQAGTLGYNRASSERSKRGIERRLAKQKSAQGVVYFIGSPGDGKLPFGIWQRITFGKGYSAIKPIVIFQRFAAYEKRFDFYYVGEITVRKHFPNEFSRALASTIKGVIL
jgi:hypothetical protein